MSTTLPDSPEVAIGVGFDTARFGHHVTFLRTDLQPACPAFDFPESRAGYDRVLQQLHSLHVTGRAGMCKTHNGSFRRSRIGK